MISDMLKSGNQRRLFVVCCFSASEKRFNSDKLTGFCVAILPMMLFSGVFAVGDVQCDVQLCSSISVPFEGLSEEPLTHIEMSKGMDLFHLFSCARDHWMSYLRYIEVQYGMCFLQHQRAIKMERSDGEWIKTMINHLAF